MDQLDQQYKVATAEAEHLHHKIKDLIDDPQHPLGHQLLESAHRLYSDVKAKKNPRSLEQESKAIMDLLQRIRHDGDQVMDFRHTDLLYKGYEKLRADLRKFSNY